MPTLFEASTIGSARTTNRIAMAPMTRSRATPEGHATDSMARYYGQRSTAGLIVTEGVQPSLTGQGYPDTPGLHTAEQAESWKPVVKAARADGALFFAQLMHAGRVGHPDVRGLRPVGPSAVAAPGQIYTPTGRKDPVVPRELTAGEIRGVIREHVDAARNALAAGFDGVEVHGANGYLTQQFLSTSANLRTDEWGGSVRGRIRFAVELVRALADALGPGRAALRVSPASTSQGIEEGDPLALYTALLEELREIPLAYLHVVEAPGRRDLTRALRAAWPHTLVLNPHRDEDPLPPHEAGADALADAGADLVSFASAFLANPDLPARLAAGGPYNRPDRATFYGGDDHGYLDYPTLGA
ncbi:alkene reductase [Nocardiopsis changdeensis]|uniref:Alkene reductase n=1 Tax=Nocardiopsis changdeensis TaxID=2831969 RepID=A0ABX8BKD7_9ACTN|nr:MULTISPECIES: alkene reductase [Nocardiopsis]QUX20888.1 alkene reductase [Nocardiopsis changdeensis]QYX36820.1 alkene reductase [Nocardiopsis sp. MT53]